MTASEMSASVRDTADRLCFSARAAELFHAGRAPRGNLALFLHNELFADAVSGSCPEELTTAENFFGWLIKGIGRHPSGRRRFASARGAMAKWLAGNDPLRIAEDPECQYRLGKARYN